ncbi:phosphatidate cytidylyltransferase [Psychromonas sp. SR45-3]|uniref:phosphatidate cytidylyltransferase n=1 Tax=Psychromonas sp. SR45-3 TaxID=2760930 RepID=UPI0015F8A8DD|nr:phosphatidate cytidylyltransferase [Psychromonas sp. SR45-3]MBB1274852.1 phosphatidate cytidylyltransferase [Psychromonas sp. SR45-3]
MFNIPTHSFYMMIFVVILLITGSLIRWRLQVKNPQTDYLELKQRIQSWWWMIAILFGILLAPTTISIIFFALLSFLALKEFFSIMPTRQADRRILLWAYLAIPLQYYWVASNWYGMFLIFIPIYVFLFLPMRAVFIGETKGFIRSLGTIHWAVMLSVLCVSHIAYLLQLPVKNEQAGALGLVLFLIFITQFNDVCQYIWGKTLGKHKIIPKVSPKKTWEGFIGGVITVTLISGCVAPYLTPLTMVQGFVAGTLIAISGFVGDVVISSVKRDLAIKDSGTLIPGHGGLLDRIDSLIYTAPLFFHFLYYLHY